MYRGDRIALIIPALNEEETIAQVLAGVNRDIVDQLIVVDNGCVDATAALAREGGAQVVAEPRRGYGSACLAGVHSAMGAGVVVFMDADGSDDPDEIELLLRSLHETGAAMVVGSRTLGRSEPGALTPIQRFGNGLTCRLVWLLWGVRYTDLGPFRAVRWDDLRSLDMRDPGFGWTIEMQVKAAQRRLKVVEVPVTYSNRRGGRSKISGNLIGSARAGKRILGYVGEAKVQEAISSFARALRRGPHR